MKSGLIGKGAEAVLYVINGEKTDDEKYICDINNTVVSEYEGDSIRIISNFEKIVVKYRLPKRYRHHLIDNQFRLVRTRREARVIKKLEDLKAPVPKLVYSNEKSFLIAMEYIEGKKLSTCLEEVGPDICKEIGYYVGDMHKNGVVHSDLTTSNMILRGEKVYFIDFGLSYFSSRIEDFAVDIHLFREALESKHWKIYKNCFQKFLEGYKKSFPEKFDIIYERFKKVELRGRYKKLG